MTVTMKENAPSAATQFLQAAAAENQEALMTLLTDEASYTCLSVKGLRHCEGKAQVVRELFFQKGSDQTFRMYSEEKEPMHFMTAVFMDENQRVFKVIRSISYEFGQLAKIKKVVDMVFALKPPSDVKNVSALVEPILKHKEFASGASLERRVVWFGNEPGLLYHTKPYPTTGDQSETFKLYKFQGNSAKVKEELTICLGDKS